MKTLAILEIALAIALALQIHYLTRFSSVLESMARLAGTGGYGAALVTLLFSVLTAIVIPTTIMGATFPLTVRLFEQTRGESESHAVGTVYFANTIGAILGSLLAGFVLIRLIGSQNGLFLMAAINLAVGILLGKTWIGRRLGIPATAVLAIAFFTARPNGVLLSAGIFEAKAPMLIFREDVTATVTLRQLRPDFLSLELNGVNVAGALILDPQGVAAVTRGIDAHTDDLPAVEYESGRVIDRDGAWLANFTLLGRAMSPLPRAFKDGDPALLAQADALRRKRYLDHWKLLRASLKR